MQQIHLVVVSLVQEALHTSAVVFPACMLTLSRVAMLMRTLLIVWAVSSTALATLAASGSSSPSPYIS